MILSMVSSPQEKTLLHYCIHTVYDCMIFFQDVFRRSMQSYLSIGSSIFMTELCNASFHKLAP